MIDDRNNVEGDSSHVEEHAGDVKKRSEEEDALSAEEDFGVRSR